MYFRFDHGEGDDKEIYLALKFSSRQIDEVAHQHKVFGDLMEHQIRFKFDKQMKDTFVAFDARQYYECIRLHF